MATIEEQTSPFYFSFFFIFLFLLWFLFFLICCCSSFFFFFLFFFLFFFFFFFVFFALLLLLPLLVLFPLTQLPPREMCKNGDHLENKKPVVCRGKRISRHRVLLKTRRGAGESEPQKSNKKKDISFEGCVVEPPKRPQLLGPFSSSFLHFARRFRRFREIASK